MTRARSARLDQSLPKPVASQVDVMLGGAAYVALSRALLTTGKVRLVIEGEGETVAATFAVRTVDGGGKRRGASAGLVQVEEFQPVKGTLIAHSDAPRPGYVQRDDL